MILHKFISLHRCSRPQENERVTELKLAPKQTLGKQSSLKFVGMMYHERALKLRHLKKGFSGLRAEAQLMLAAEFGSIARCAVTVYKTRAIKT